MLPVGEEAAQPHAGVVIGVLTQAMAACVPWPPAGDRRIGYHAVRCLAPHGWLADRAHLAVRVGLVHHPFAALAHQRQLDHAQVLAEEATHHRRHATYQAALGIHLLHAGVVRAGELGVRVAQQQGVDARHAGQVPAAVFHVRRVGVVVQSAVQHGDDQVRVLRLELGQVFLRRLHHAAHGHPALELLLVPLHDRRRREAEDAHLQRHLQLAAVRGVGLDGLAHHRPRLEQRLAVARTGHVGQHQREMRAGAALGRAAVHVHRRAGDLRQERQAVVELVVAGGGAVVADAVHRAIDRQLLVAGHRAGQRLVVGQHRALDGVAVVEQEGVGKFLPRLADQRHGALVAQRRVGLELVVVVAEDVGVQVGGF
jgi:hypothetical protein